MVNLARVLVLTGVIALSPTAAAIGGPLLESANRLARQAGRQTPSTAAASATAAQGTLAESSMSKRKKFFIFAVAAIGVAAGIYAIDHGVEDNTPSSRGTRRD